MSAVAVAEITQPSNPVFPLCEHIKDNELRCGSPAIRGRHFCYFHSRAHQPGPRLGHRHYRAPLPETIQSLQLTIMQITEALGSGRITDKTAGKLLYAVQLSTNLIKLAKAERPLKEGAPFKPSVGLSGVVDEPIATEISPAMQGVLAAPCDSDNDCEPAEPVVEPVQLSGDELDRLAANLLNREELDSILPALGDGEKNPAYNQALRRYIAYDEAQAKLRTAGINPNDVKPGSMPVRYQRHQP